MPVVDFPLEKLKVYQGISPRPEDMDAFWDRSLAEMRSIDPKVELIPAKFQTDYAECFEMFFTGAGGARIHAKLARPRRAADRKGPAVVHFHGYTGDCGDWISKMGYVAAGFTFAALDCRGQGGKSEDAGGVRGNTQRGHIIRGLDDDGPEKLLFRNIFLDCAQLTYLVMDMPGVDRTRVGAYGLSQGGGLTLACAGLVPELNRAAPCYPFLSDYRRVWEMDLGKEAYIELREFFRHFDPRHEREDAIFTRLGYIDVQNLAPRIKSRIMMFTGLMDDICPPSTQFAAYNKITSEKNVYIYPDFGHEYLPEKDDMTFLYMQEMLK